LYIKNYNKGETMAISVWRELSQIGQTSTNGSHNPMFPNEEAIEEATQDQRLKLRKEMRSIQPGTIVIQSSTILQRTAHEAPQWGVPNPATNVIAAPGMLVGRIEQAINPTEAARYRRMANISANELVVRKYFHTNSPDRTLGVNCGTCALIFGSMTAILLSHYILGILLMFIGTSLKLWNYCVIRRDTPIVEKLDTLIRSNPWCVLGKIEGSQATDGFYDRHRCYLVTKNLPNGNFAVPIPLSY
jgi:hypothetical protein